MHIALCSKPTCLATGTCNRCTVLIRYKLCLKIVHFASVGNSICRSYLSSEQLYDKGSCLATVTLTAGQSVYVDKDDNIGALNVEGNNIASFSGFLLYPQ